MSIAAGFPYLPFLWSCGYNEGVLPGVDLLSRWRLSGSPVDLEIGFGPGLIPMMFLLK